MGVVPVHVLHVIDSVDRAGGAEQALAVTASRLVRRGVTLDVAYLLDMDGFQPELVDAGASLFGVHAKSRAATVSGLRRVIRDRTPDLVHSTLFEADVAGRAAAVTCRVPVVSSLVNSAYGPEQFASPTLRWWKLRAAQALDAATARGVCRFHALTDHVADVMARRLAVRRSRIDVVPRGRDPELLGAARKQRDAVRAALGIGADTPVVLAAARQEYQKGLDILVDAFGSVRTSIPEAVLLLAGPPGTQTERLRAAAEKVGGEASVRFLGERRDVAELMGAADVFALSSRWEGLGSVVIEAMGCGTPVVATDLPPVREIVGSTECAVLVPPGHTAALATALTGALSDRAEAEARAAAAAARFLDTFTVDRVVDRMVEFYARARSGSRT
ncbi:glycosyltransferase [Yinghuangia sp. ASG 101]|uniref:glycosyltransferase n=1 Tax=Yinghuangia sp. ASG 101 TaxID=2896848 RepID=UPI001E4795EB|nr:glycosyltransferase [Yinghuangia sp. ASG 101]UGQ10572.1 glycosyltransferase [Yinghuangia sp. ASG 101]